ncbi:MAG: sulfate permease [Gammaproteobacteria bacterium]|nr:sulfate permease [Gammaproteobacteria bacterium]
MNSYVNGTGARLSRLEKIFPIVKWLRSYERHKFFGDSLAGLIVAIMLVPQAMAYALLAGLPPQVGLYASIVPIFIYSLFGSSRYLSVGPVALVSLLVASSASAIAQSNGEQYLAVVLVLALLSGLILIIMGLARLGFLVNFMSQPVITGFTSAAAILIALSQFELLLGFEIPTGHNAIDTMFHIFSHLHESNWTTISLAIFALITLAFFRRPLTAILTKHQLNPNWTTALTRMGPLFVVVVGSLVVWLLRLDQSVNVAVVGSIPAGLPPLTQPVFDLALWQQVLPASALIAFVGFLESVSIGKALASKRRQKIYPNQEMIAVGAANVGAAFTGGYCVAGSFSRSAVNFSAGANSALSSVFTSVIMLLTALILTPLFFFLPKAILAAIIIVAVGGLIDAAAFRRAWRYSKADWIALLVTFLSVLLISVEVGMLIGIAISIMLYLYRTARPHIAVVGRVHGTEHFRNVERYQVETRPEILAIRIDESLYFANTRFLEDQLRGMIADSPKVDHLVLILSAVNWIDTGALESLESMIDELRDAGVTVHLAEVKGRVLDRLHHTDFFNNLKPGKLFLSTHEAILALDWLIDAEPRTDRTGTNPVLRALQTKLSKMVSKTSETATEK